MDPFFRKVIKKMGAHPSFKMKSERIYTKNRGGEDIVCPINNVGRNDIKNKNTGPSPPGGRALWPTENV